MTMNDEIDVANCYLAITVKVGRTECPSTTVTVPDGFEILLLEELRNEIVELPLRRQSTLVEGIEPQIAFRTVAGPAGPNLIVDLMDVFAASASLIDRDRPWYDMLLRKLLG